MQEQLARLAGELRSGNLVAFIGAGASRTYLDEGSGREWPGLPASADIVEAMRQERAYVTLEHTFPQACFLWKQREGRGSLEKFLLAQLDRLSIKPLPAHTLLAHLAFSAYFTTNFDTLLERALQNARRPVCPIIDDDDVARAKSGAVPVVKLNGCVTRPRTLVAAEDEFVPLVERAPIMEALTQTELAKKTVLFVGFALSDPHFAALYQGMRRTLGDYAPRSFAVVHDVDEYRRTYWEELGVELLAADLTETLRGLARQVQETPQMPAVYVPADDWTNNAFFVSLNSIGSLPSETQVIDAFLQHLLDEIHSPAFELTDILVRARQALKTVLGQRANYEALERIGFDLLDRVEATSMSKDDAEDVVREEMAARQVLGRQFSSLARSVVTQSDRLLVFSQSVRVLQLLRGVPRGMQATCHVFVAECRPKSPQPFQDAIAVCEHLGSTAYEVTVIPDAAIGNLLQRGQISKVIMGAHGVHMVEGHPTRFVNTCGTGLICTAAAKADVPVYVVAERSKVSDFASFDELPEVSYTEEEQLFSAVTPALAELQAGGQGITTLNIGYDICGFDANSVLVLEDGVYASAPV
jgi:translation initiation factor 2B subunit (eIF-2B alpha/beta/delta family)